jgi:hypothetical protein
MAAFGGEFGPQRGTANFAAFKMSSHRLQQNGEAGGFSQIVVGVCLHAFAHVVEIGIAGDQNDRGLPRVPGSVGRGRPLRVC